MKCLKSRKDEIKQALLEEIVDISSAQLQDFDWQLKVRIYLWVCLYFSFWIERNIYFLQYYASKISIILRIQCPIKISKLIKIVSFVLTGQSLYYQ